MNMRLSISAIALVASANMCCLQTYAFAPSHTAKNNAARSNCPSKHAPIGTSSTTLHAKKGKKKNKSNNNKNQPKKSGMEWATNFSLKPFESTALRELAATAAASFEGRTGKPLSEELRGSADVPKALWNAKVAVVVVGTKESEDDSKEDDDKDAEDSESSESSERTTNAKEDALVVKYANVAALETVGLQPSEYERLIAPSGPNAADITIDHPVLIDVPAQMKGDKKYEGGYKKKILRAVDENGEDQSIAIVDAHRWALEKSMLLDGKFVTDTIGVAYAWSQWMRGESTLCSLGGVEELVLNADQLEKAVAEQAVAIRTLKEEHGLGNKDPEVKEAVEKLLRLKEMLATVSG